MVSIFTTIWTQSMVRDLAQRTLLFNRGRTLNRPEGRPDMSRALAELYACHDNLLRMWATP